VVLSSAFRRVLIERYGVSPWRIRVEPPGVDLEHFSPGDRSSARNALGLEGCPFVAVCVRRLVPRMGLDVLVDAWAHVLAELPSGARLMVAGEGPLHKELDEQVTRLGLEGSVCLLGRVDDDALVALYQAADVGIVPTRAFEGFGLVITEAAACGTPTIVTRVGGLPETVAHLDRSLVVPPGDAPALGRRIVAATRAGGLPARSTTRRFAESHSWVGVVERHRVICREITESRPDRDRIRVVYLDHVAQLSGGELALLHLVPHLSAVEPHVVLAEDGPLAEALGQAGVSVEVLPMNERARSLRKASATPGQFPAAALLSTVGYVWRLARRLRRLQPDLVHTNSLKAGVYGSLAARIAGVPVVWHVRDRIAPDYLPAPAPMLLRLMIRRLAAGVIANSQTTMQTLGPQSRAEVVHSVVPSLSAPVAPQPDRPLTVGMIGRLAPWKGQDLCLRAFAEAFPASGARCVFVGAALFGEGAFERALSTLARELGVAERVDFRGFRLDVGAELRHMDMLVHASLIPEPFGQVVLQGMSARVPVIAPNAGGPAELITHGVDGVLYPMGDQAALAAAMRALADDPDRRVRIASAAVERVVDYTPAAVAAQTQRLYHDVIATHRTPGSGGPRGPSAWIRLRSEADG
jgi:glycosyltransferase involved in cell wall biosynthesis